MHDNQPKRKRNVIGADILPDDVREATAKLAEYSRAKAEHENAIKLLSKTMLAGTTEEKLKDTIKSYCKEHQDVEDIFAGGSNVTIRAIRTNSTSLNLNEASVTKMVTSSLQASAAIRRARQLDVIMEEHDCTKDNAERLLDTLVTIDNIEVLKHLNIEMEDNKTVTERHAIYFDHNTT